MPKRWSAFLWLQFCDVPPVIKCISACKPVSPSIMKGRSSWSSAVSCELLPRCALGLRHALHKLHTLRSMSHHRSCPSYHRHSPGLLSWALLELICLAGSLLRYHLTRGDNVLFKDQLKRLSRSRRLLFKTFGKPVSAVPVCSTFLD